MLQSGVKTDIFGIGEVYGLQREGLWPKKNREVYREFGYFGGGNVLGPNYVSTVDRIDYSNDTANANSRASLGIVKITGATGNSNFGYWGGGSTAFILGSATSRVDRIDYSNDLATASIRGSLSSPQNTAAAGNSNFGYFGAGDSFGSRVDRIDYSNDLATAGVRGPLSLARGSLAATGNFNFGWFGGGNGPRSTVDRIDYSNDLAIASVRGPLTSARYGGAATGNSNFGWFGGGSGNASTIDRVDYSNDSATASVRGPLSNGRSFLGATGNSNFGYFSGGQIFPTYLTRVDRVDYSNDTITASTRGPLSQGRNTTGASSGSFGGAPVSYLGAPWVATNTPTDPLPTYIRDATKFNDSNTLPDNLPFKRVLGSFGYFGGGGGPRSTVDRIDYSNDLAIASIRGPLTSARYALGTGNSNFGYYGKSLITVLDRIDYSNDLSVAITRGSLFSSGNERSGSTENSNFGYISFGNSTSLLNFSNDFVSALSRTPFNFSRLGRAATGNSNFGYFGGGLLPSPFGGVTTIERINYSNDTQTASIRGSLIFPRWRLAATGNSNFGYFVAGVGANSAVDRIDYSNDSVSASTRGSLARGQNGAAATGNSNYGWVGTQSTSRIDYSNDLAQSLIRGPLSAARNYMGASTNARNS
jgi:hypothetical protein